MQRLVRNSSTPFLHSQLDWIPFMEAGFGNIPFTPIAPRYIMYGAPMPELVFAGLSTCKTTKSLKSKGVKVSHVTSQNWTKQYAEIMTAYVEQITPRVREQ